MEAVDAQYVLLCDGALRKVDKPKKKKRKHVSRTGGVAQLVIDKLSDGVRVTNPDLRKCLDAFEDKR